MRWGLPWSFLSKWGIPRDPNVDDICKLADERVLVHMNDEPANRKFRDFICDIIEPLGAFITVCRDVEQAFDLENASGEQLDFLGNVLDLKRQGFNDPDYRRFLQIQRDLILSSARAGSNWTGTTNNVLAICRTFVGPGGGTITIVNFGAYNFELSIPSITDPAEFAILNRFICKALYAGVLGQIIEVFDAFSLWNSDDVVVAGGGIWCSDDVVIPNCATWAQSTPIGDCPAPA